MSPVHVIKVPDVGEGIAEVELVAWHVAPGQTISEDQALADVMTDKASVEIPSPVAGRVLALGAGVGTMMAVGSELIRIETTAAAPDEPRASGAPAPERALPSEADVVPAASSGAAPAPSAAVAPAAAAAGLPIASPAVRRRAWELGLDLAEIAPSGPGGRVMRRDLDAHVGAHGSRVPWAAGAQGSSVATAAAATGPAVAVSADAAAAAGERHDETAVPVMGVRRRIAIQMQESKRRIPHFSYVEEVDVTELEGARAALNARWAGERGKLTLLPLLARAMVLAVRQYPQINARFDDEAGIVTRHGAVHLGVATDTPNGLMVPVLRHAEALSVWAMAAEVARLADAARSGRATRAELSGSTITLSSLGALGGIVSTPVINRPEVAIVAVNRIVQRPLARDGAVVLRQTMNLSSSFDHRVVDGIDAARFVQAMRAALETPALLFVD